MSECRAVNLKELGVNRDVFDKIYSMGYEDGQEDKYYELFSKYSKLLEEVKVDKDKAENIIDNFISWCFDHADYDLHITSDQQLYEYLLKLFGVWKEKYNG